MPPRYRRFLMAVGLFGAGDFAPALLLLLAAQQLTPAIGFSRATATAALFYVMHNFLSAIASMAAGRLADRLEKGGLLAAAYSLGLIMALILIFLPLNAWSLAAAFCAAGLRAGMVETLEDSFAAELVPGEYHGTAFGLLASVNGLGDFVSSFLVGLLWTAAGTSVAFAYSGALSLAGALLVLRAGRRPLAR